MVVRERSHPFTYVDAKRRSMIRMSFNEFLRMSYVQYSMSSDKVAQITALRTIARSRGVIDK